MKSLQQSDPVREARILELTAYYAKVLGKEKKRQGRKYRKVMRIDTGEVFESLSECQRKTGITAQQLCQNIPKGKPCHGMLFKYAA